MKELKVKEAETESFVIGPDTSSDLGVSESDVLLARNPVNGKGLAGEAKIGESVEEKTVMINRCLFESIGLNEGSELMISRYEKEIKKPIEVTFGVEDKGKSDRDPLTLIKENEGEFIDFVKDILWTKDSKFLWRDKKLIVSIDEVDVEIDKDDVIDFNRLEEFSLVISETDFYSAVFLVDLSGSMETKDLAVKEIDSLIEEIKEAVDSPVTSEFIDDLEDNSKIKRSQAAAFCVLVYLVREIERGDKISMIPFSDEASVLLFQDLKYFASDVCDLETGLNKIIEDIKYHPRGRTNISDALNEAVETMKDFDHQEKKMIVLLTDGEPKPPSIDDKDAVMKVIDDRLAPRKDVIINTIGLGDQVNHHLLDSIATKTGGEYTYVNSLQGMIETYSRYAESISDSAFSP